MNNESLGFTYTDANIEPNTITFNSAESTWVMQITADRKIIVNEDVEVSEAAQSVLDALQPLLLKTNPAKTLIPLTEDECRTIIEKHNWFAKSWAEMAMEIQDAILRKAQEK